MLSKILIFSIVLSSSVFADSEVVVFNDMVKKDKKIYKKNKKRFKRATYVKKSPEYFYIDENGNEIAIKEPYEKTYYSNTSSVKTNYRRATTKTTTKMFIDKPVLKKK